MLKLSGEDFKAAIIKTLKQSIKNSLQWKKTKKFQQRKRAVSENCKTITKEQTFLLLESQKQRRENGPEKHAKK